MKGWWVDLMAGAADRPHPAYGERLKAKLRDGVLRLSGEVASQSDRRAVISEGEKGWRPFRRRRRTPTTE